MRCPAWSEGSAITAPMPRERSRARLERDEYALSARTRTGRVRGRPGPTRGTAIASSSGANIGESPPWPGPRSTTRGRPLPSHRWWILVRQPAAGAADRVVRRLDEQILVIPQIPPCPAGQVRAVLVRAVDRGVDTDRPVDLPDLVGVREQRRSGSASHVPSPAEPAVPLPRGLPRPELLRQVPPRDPRPEPVHDRLNDRSMITEPVAPLTIRRRHQRRDQRPMGIGQHSGTRHAPTITDPTAPTSGDTP